MKPSPYFTPIQQQRQDFSSLQNAGRAWGEAYGKIGNAIGQIGSAYFEKKANDKKVEDYMASPDFEEKFLASGGSSAELQQMKTDEKFRDKIRDQYIKSVGGIDKFKEEANRKETELRAEQKHNALMQTSQEQLKALQFTNQKNEELVKTQKLSNSYLTFATNYKKNPENQNNLLGAGQKFIQNMVDEGASESDVAIAQRAVLSTNKSMGMGMHSGLVVPTLMENMRKTEFDGNVLKQVNFTSPAQMNEYYNQVIAENPNLPQPQKDALLKRMESVTAPAGKIREIADASFKSQGFQGYQVLAGQMQDIKEIESILDRSLFEIPMEDGSVRYEVRNSIGANITLIKMAKLAQGAGVLSEGDVKRVQGDQRLSSLIERLMDKRIGQEKILTAQDVAEGGLYHKLSGQDGREYKVGDKVIFGGASVNDKDLIAMRDLVDAKREEFNTATRQYVPNIIREIQSQFGGLTLKEIDEATGLGDFLEGGIQSLGKVDPSVSKRNVRAIFKAIVDGRIANEKDFDRFLKEDVDFHPSERVGLEKAHRIALAQVKAIEEEKAGYGSDYYRRKQEPEPEPSTLMMPKNPKEIATQELINERKSSPRNSMDAEMDDDGKVVKQSLTAISSASAGMSVGKFAQNRINTNEYIRDNITGKDGAKFNSMDSSLTSRQKYDIMLSEKLDDPKTLREEARKVGIDVDEDTTRNGRKIGKKYGGAKGNEKLKKEVTKRLNKQVTDKAGKVLGKSFLKKFGLTLGSGFITGGLGWLIGSIDFMNDIGNMREDEINEQIANIQSKQSGMSKKELDASEEIIKKLKYKRDNFFESASKATSWDKRMSFGNF